MGERTRHMADQVATYGALPAVRYGRPTYDFAAAPSLFVTEDLRQEDFSLAHRNNINAALGQSEVYEAEAVAVRRAKETDAAAALAAERAAASYAAAAAMAQAEEYRQMLASATSEQSRAQAEHANAARAAEEAAAVSLDTGCGAVSARLAYATCY